MTADFVTGRSVNDLSEEEEEGEEEERVGGAVVGRGEVGPRGAGSK